MDKLLLEFIEFSKQQKEKWPNINDEALVLRFLNDRKLILMEDNGQNSIMHQQGIQSAMHTIGILRFWEKKIFIDAINTKPIENEKTTP